jgi:hypothetical protein
VRPAVFSSDQRRSEPESAEEAAVITLLIIVLVLMFVGAAPAWPHSRDWGYGPSGALGIIVLLLVILALTGRL